MNNSSECADNNRTRTDDLLKGGDVEFPVEPGFVSKPPRMDPQVMFDRCEEMLTNQVLQPGFYDRWRTDKIDVEFVL